MEPFAWYPRGTEDLPHVRTLDTIKSLSGGVAVLLEIIEADDLNEGDAACFGSVLSRDQVGALMRLAIVASEAISNECEKAFEGVQTMQATGSP